MAGIFSFSSDSRDVLLLLLGLAGAVVFFLLYPSQHPLSTAEISTEADEIELRSVEQLSSLGYSLSDYRTEVHLRPYSVMLDSLQREMGRQRAVEVLRADTNPGLKAFYWEVAFYDPFSEEDGNVEMSVNSSGDPPSPGENAGIRVRFDPQGNFLELRNSLNRLPRQLLDREALARAFGERIDDTLVSLPIQGQTDSALTRRLYFDLEQPVEGGPSRLQAMRENFSRGQPFRINRLEAERMARHFMEQSGWARSTFARDTVFIRRVESTNSAVVRFHSAPVEGQQLRLDVQIAPTGSLLQMNAAWNPDRPNGATWGTVAGTVENAVVVIFLLGCLILFFYRLRARAIDTRSALVVAILSGLGIAGFFILQNIASFDLFGDAGGQFEAIFLLIGTGIMAAAASVGFFILFATSDSVTRQHWPQKLATYDYIRQGTVFNKPVGSVVLRSVTLSLVLAGIWTLLLWAMQGLYLGIPEGGVFLDGTAGWPPFYVMLHNSWFSFTAVLGIFLILGSLVWSRSRSRLWTGAAMTLACGVFFPLNIAAGPAGPEFLAGCLVGLALTLIYLKWDFSTLLISLFLFLGLVRTASGWVAPDSPDLYVFVTFLVFVLLLISAASLAILMGEEERVLPRYVPEYVEELAQEERIKQELVIAREVQQSFLPTRIPRLASLDLAAICQPAHETGGDYYDLIPLDEHRMAVAIGDVSGKGIQAAFYMTFIKGIIHSLCRETDSPADLLKKTNRLFFDNAQKGTFISLVYGIIDTRSRTFTFARAGHNPALHYDRSEDRIRELQPGGLGIGLTREESFDLNIHQTTVELEKDDILLLYTDGIVEALDEERRFYGAVRLRELLKAHGGQTSKGVLDSLFEDVREFVGEAKQHDDMTMVVIRYG
ncbi:MAG: SpoIIE family protein phosphatase [Balneolaceae bacterium]|nr:SpoIIE family protein phosphatase [Balneolaceae bacterium]